MNRFQKIASSVYVNERFYWHFKNIVAKISDKNRRRPSYLNIRKDWGNISPVTKIKKDDKKYNRKKQDWKKELE